MAGRPQTEGAQRGVKNPPAGAQRGAGVVQDHSCGEPTGVGREGYYPLPSPDSLFIWMVSSNRVRLFPSPDSLHTYFLLAGTI
ncbi:MAG: hypothetical protein A4E42_01538 [Methanoregulaceae archaeon PtaU1.Bin222]|nr:MAG: hypothetical protein A4E42_01538 [Methanoregulaceae archaeon PtaU1.Bin222]